ncbi:hypothetical protein SAMN05428975_5298 [Mucilaginibacter sp. OK268]|jgi:hypothetical protein|nr:hypothetical protein SAMN05428975_5298 [Mucilaginibacter sp. OK268]
MLTEKSVNHVNPILKKMTHRPFACAGVPAKGKQILIVVKHPDNVILAPVALVI